MYCSNCGKFIPDDSNYCAYCGTPQKEGLKPAEAHEVKWETCEIVFNIGKGGGFWLKQYFWARAIGASGQYNAGESERFRIKTKFGGDNGPHADDQVALTAHKNLIRKLVEDGWESTGSGIDWYNDRFRRPVSK